MVCKSPQLLMCPPQYQVFRGTAGQTMRWHEMDCISGRLVIISQNIISFHRLRQYRIPPRKLAEEHGTALLHSEKQQSLQTSFNMSLLCCTANLLNDFKNQGFFVCFQQYAPRFFLFCFIINLHLFCQFVLFLVFVWAKLPFLKKDVRLFIAYLILNSSGIWRHISSCVVYIV